MPKGKVKGAPGSVCSGVGSEPALSSSVTVTAPAPCPSHASVTASSAFVQGVSTLDSVAVSSGSVHVSSGSSLLGPQVTFTGAPLAFSSGSSWRPGPSATASCSDSVLQTVAPQGPPFSGPHVSLGFSPRHGTGTASIGQHLGLAPFPPHWAVQGTFPQYASTPVSHRSTQPYLVSDTASFIPSSAVPLVHQAGELNADTSDAVAGEAVCYDSGSSAPDYDDVSEPEEASLPFSFQDAVSCLGYFAPEKTVAFEAPSVAAPSFAEELLGPSIAKNQPRSLLKESAMVLSALGLAEKEVRGGSSAPSPAAPALINGALPVGTFLKPHRAIPSFARILRYEALAESRLTPSDDDSLLHSRAPARIANRRVTLHDKFLSDQEECSRRSLVAHSVLDSFLGGLIAALRDPSKDEFQVRSDVDNSAVTLLVRSMAATLQASTAGVARSHVNTVLARREAFLSESLASSSSKKNLRALPLDPQGSFFGSHAGPTLEKQAEQARTSAFVRPQAFKRPRPAQEGESVRPRAKAPKIKKESAPPWRQTSQRPARGRGRGGWKPKASPPKPSPQ